MYLLQPDISVIHPSEQGGKERVRGDPSWVSQEFYSNSRGWSTPGKGTSFSIFLVNSVGSPTWRFVLSDWLKVKTTTTEEHCDSTSRHGRFVCTRLVHCREVFCSSKREWPPAVLTTYRSQISLCLYHYLNGLYCSSILFFQTGWV